MSADEKDHRHEGPMRCGPWMRHGRFESRLRIGILLIIIGAMWLGARMGLLDLTWLHTVPFWPLVIILCGVWMVYEGLSRRGK